MYDYMVVGAGIVGLATAYHIKQMDPGSTVLVIDKEDSVGAGDTAKSAAAFTNRTNLRLAKGAISFYLEVQSEGLNLAALKVGYLFVVDGRTKSTIKRR
ncbi:FAD-dependent oxidoreductase [Acidilobus sp. 7A]|uniref:FAD-dependent oxidoreductase n=1 Tax=Acidilobus sp. 7A TaxID=1577685 RepID=UPI000E3EB4AD|nr:FAD-dependent oxidoreductase [Acidilobus sp. 7A]